MNAKRYASLSPKLKKVIDDTMTGREKEIGHEWDKLDAIGKKIMMKAGMKPIVLSAEQRAKFREVGVRVTEQRVAALEKKGLPARQVHAMMKALAAKTREGLAQLPAEIALGPVSARNGPKPAFDGAANPAGTGGQGVFPRRRPVPDFHDAVHHGLGHAALWGELDR